MPQIEKSSITISTAAAVLTTIIGVGGGVIGNYWATRSAVELELNQLRNDLRYEVSQLKNADDRTNARVDQLARVYDFRSALKPEEPAIKRER